MSAQRGDKLLVLESLAKKWVDDEVFAERARALISSHNDEYNRSGDFWLCERIGAKNNTCLFLSLCCERMSFNFLNKTHC